MSLIIKWLNVILTTIKDNKLGPTYATRILYLGSVIIHYVIGIELNNRVYEVELKRIKNYDKKHNDSVINQGFKYMYELLDYPFTVPISNTIYSPAITAINNIKTFLDNRNNDNWKIASPYLGDLPNNPVNIEVDTILQDLNTELGALIPLTPPATHLTTWTPLKHSDPEVIQNYLTPYWGNVTPIIPIQKYLDIADINKVNNRDNEIKQMLAIYENMTDYHRVVAEYFQGGKVTPPGIWNIWAIYAIKASKFTAFQSARIIYALNCSLFTASIVAWKIKLTYMQSRPIQCIRILPEQQVTTWDGTIVSNKLWKPFQQSQARTPPFPDYVSGHSTFSGAAAIIFNHFFQNNLNQIKFEKFSTEHADMISPLLNNTYNNTVKCINCNAGSSNVSKGNAVLPFPNSATMLNFTTWDELASLSGISRIYGGIHCQNANHVGIIIGNEIAKDILEYFKF